jgi:hypothetical protein
MHLCLERSDARSSARHRERLQEIGAVDQEMALQTGRGAMPANTQGARQIKLALIGKPSAEKRALFCAALPDAAAVPAAAVSEGTTHWTASCCPQLPSAACGDAHSCRPCDKRSLPACICELSVPSLNAMAADDSALPDVLVVAVPAAAVFRKGKRRPSAEKFAGAQVRVYRVFADSCILSMFRTSPSACSHYIGAKLIVLFLLHSACVH